MNPVVAGVLLDKAGPNLNSVSALAAGATELPNLKPPGGGFELDSKVEPNLNPVNAVDFLLSSVAVEVLCPKDGTVALSSDGEPPYADDFSATVLT